MKVRFTCLNKLSLMSFVPPKTELQPCPPHEVLRMFARGQGLIDEATEELAKHLSVCTNCAADLRTQRKLWFREFMFGRDLTGVATANRFTGDPGPTEQAECLEQELNFWPPPALFREHPRYRVLDLLQPGAQGAVYLAATSDEKHEPVAIKYVRVSPTATRRGHLRWQREVEILRALPQHPRLVQILAAEVSNAERLIVMEFVRGTDLATLLRFQPDSRLPVPIATRWGIEILEGLAAAWHAGQIVHRDVKPSNIMVMPNGHLKLLDFGIAKSLDLALFPDLSAAGAFFGTPCYAAPEQDQVGQAIDLRADLYAVGCVLFEMIVGRAAYVGVGKQTSPTAVRIAHHQSQIPSLRQNVPEVTRDLQQIIHKLLAKAPKDRFATHEEVIDALQRYAAAGQPMHHPLTRSSYRERIESSASRTSQPKRKRPSVWRRGAPVWTATLMLFVLVAVTAFGTLVNYSRRATSGLGTTRLGEDTEVKDTFPEAIRLRGNGRWRLEQDRLVLDQCTGEEWLIFGNPQWRDYDYQFEVRTTDFPCAISSLFLAPSETEITKRC